MLQSCYCSQHYFVYFAVGPDDGLSAEKFIARDSNNGLSVAGSSMYDKLRDQLASLLGTAGENVEIFTVRNVEPTDGWDIKEVDVMFAAHGSPYYRSSKLNGLVWANKDKVWIEMI